MSTIVNNFCEYFASQSFETIAFSIGFEYFRMDNSSCPGNRHKNTVVVVPKQNQICRSPIKPTNRFALKKSGATNSYKDTVQR